MRVAQLPSPLDLALYAGDAFSIGFTFTDKTTGTPLPMVGAWLAEVRSTLDDAVLATFTIDDTAASTGIVRLSLSGDDVRACGKGGAWDVQLTQAGGETRTFFAGSVTVREDITQ